ncbi:MAG: hypothetical protein QOC96_1328 [Acidobacteriota bacterium]|nr:hypothetical protein [Acidobacteriota bacterium]
MPTLFTFLKEEQLTIKFLILEEQLLEYQMVIPVFQTFLE